LEHTRRDQHSGRDGEAAQERGDGEERQSGHEDAPSAEQITRAPTEQQESAKRERVPADHPFQGTRREAEGLLDGRERYVHDRHVQHNHQVRDAEYGESLPALRIGGHARKLAAQLGGEASAEQWVVRSISSAERRMSE